MPIEDLATGQSVVTFAGATRQIKWIGRRAYDPRFVAGNTAVLPIRIEAQWGQGYVVGGIPASQSDGSDDASSEGEPGGCHQRISGTPLMRESAIVIRPVAAPQKPQPIGRRVIATKQASGRRAMALTVNPSRCRAEELGVIERFLAERGVTRCPDPQLVAQSGQSELVWDKMKRKWVRPTPPLMQMPAGQ